MLMTIGISVAFRSLCWSGKSAPFRGMITSLRVMLRGAAVARVRRRVAGVAGVSSLDGTVKAMDSGICGETVVESVAFDSGMEVESDDKVEEREEDSEERMSGAEEDGGTGELEDSLSWICMVEFSGAIEEDEARVELVEDSTGGAGVVLSSMRILLTSSFSSSAEGWATW